MSNDNDPAFPCVDQDHDGDLVYSNGLTKREQLAAMAMQGMLSSDTTIRTIASSVNHMEAVAEMAQMAGVCADALLAELAKGKT